MDRQSAHGSLRLGANPSLLIRDRDGAYGEIFVRRVRSIGIRDRPTSARSPWQNAYAERLIGSIRRECIDHVVVFGERHLRHVLLSYMDYYNSTRTHLSLDKDAPVARAVERAGNILCRPILGGLHHGRHNRTSSTAASAGLRALPPGHEDCNQHRSQASTTSVLPYRSLRQTHVLRASVPFPPSAYASQI